MANLGQVVLLSEQDKNTLFETGTVTAKGQTVNYSDNDLYMTEEAEPQGYELINSVIVTEDNQEKVSNYPYIFIETDSNGNAFELDEMLVEIKLASKLASNVDCYVRMGDRGDGHWAGIRVNNSAWDVRIHTKRAALSNGNTLAWNTSISTYSSESHYTYYNATSAVVLNTYAGVTRHNTMKLFGFGIPYQTAITQIPIGTVINIWGVRHSG